MQYTGQVKETGTVPQHIHYVCLMFAVLNSSLLRLPLQGQANRWVKAMERAAGLEVVKTSYKDFLRTLENGIRFGRPVSSSAGSTPAQPASPQSVCCYGDAWHAGAALAWLTRQSAVFLPAAAVSNHSRVHCCMLPGAAGGPG